MRELVAFSVVDRVKSDCAQQPVSVRAIPLRDHDLVRDCGLHAGQHKLAGLGNAVAWIEADDQKLEVVPRPEAALRKGGRCDGQGGAAHGSAGEIDGNNQGGEPRKRRCLSRSSFSRAIQTVVPEPRYLEANNL
jgi:hypothetical protein